MTTIQTIEDGSLEFPATEQALSYPNGLLAVGGDLSVDRLLRAYSRGIFPWYEDPQPILWWSPDPRCVLFPAELRVSRSLRKTLCRGGFRVTADRAFQQVLAGCAAPRARQRDTWLSRAMAGAYTALHRAGHAHSIEVWDGDNRLVGGLYGVALGRVFFGESMFSRRADASKTALVALVHLLKQQGRTIIDCQVESGHLLSLGARNIPRAEFEGYLPPFDQAPDAEGWTLDIGAEALAPPDPAAAREAT